MPRNLTPTAGLSATSSIDTAIEVPDADDTSSAARQQAAIQALLDNDAIIIAKIAPNTLTATLGQTLTGWLNQGAIADGAINAAKLSAASGATGTVLQRQGSGTNIIWVAPISITTGTGLDGANSGVDVIGGSDLTLSIASGGVDTTQIAGAAVDASKLDTATAGTAGQALLKGSGNQMTWGSAGSDITSIVAGTGLSGGGASGAVTINIANGGVNTTQIADNAVTYSKITARNLNWNATSQSLTSSDLSNVSITNEQAYQIGNIVFYCGQITLTASATGNQPVYLNIPTGSPTTNQFGSLTAFRSHGIITTRLVSGTYYFVLTFGSIPIGSEEARFTGWYAI